MIDEQDAGTSPRGAEQSRTAEPDIAWFRGSVEEGLARARAEERPVLLYWGVEWCPGCNTIKATVFRSRDFIQKSRLFIAIYIDGDAPGAQKWSDVFDTVGYPTLVLLRPDRTEVARLAGNTNPAVYNDILDLALGDVQPLATVLAKVTDSRDSLSSQDCKRLAYTQWHDVTAHGDYRLSEIIARAADRCPTGAQAEKTRLNVMATRQALREEQAEIRTGHAPSPLLVELLRGQYALLSDGSLPRAAQDELSPPSADQVKITESLAVASADTLRNRWLQILEWRQQDIQRTEAERLLATRQMLRFIKERDGNIAQPVVDEVVHRAEQALARVKNANERLPVIANVTGIFNFLDQHDRSIRILTKEVESSAASYEYMQLLASTESERGRPEKALEWLERAYRDTPTSATRFQAGVGYVSRMIDLRPQDEAAVRDATLELLGELERRPDELYGRTRARLRILDASLREWNADGRHHGTIVAIRARMQAICGKDELSAESRKACNEFLAAEQ